MSPDVAASIRARLLNHARAKCEEFDLTLARFAGERLIFRLGASVARERCLLKGARLLSVWITDPYRRLREALKSADMDQVWAEYQAGLRRRARV